VPFDLLVIGSSSGHTHLLHQILENVPADFPAPVAVVQHRLVGSDDTLAHALQRATRLRVVEAEDKLPLETGCLYLAPADYHLLIEDGHCALSTEPPVRLARPSIDVLFESAADAYGCRLAALLLSNAGQDGTHGLAAIRAQGGIILDQELRSSEGTKFLLSRLEVQHEC
jgi:two-component system, chemotaxis family, protein-glutamate methylesterase/glutaminase